MKIKHLILFVFVLLGIQINAQEIGLFTSYAGSSFNKFHHTYGYGVDVLIPTYKTQEIGFTFQHSFCRGEYDRIIRPNYDPQAAIIQKVDPHNQRIALKVNYLFTLLHSGRTYIKAGPELGLNFFFVDESGYQFEYNDTGEGYFQWEDIQRYRPGYGVLLEFRVTEVIHKNISVFSAINPEITIPDTYNMDGVPDASANRWLNFNLGLRYSLSVKNQ